MSEIKLLPCPLCGSEARLVGHCVFESAWKVRCGNDKCNCLIEFNNKEEAIKTWNTRKSMQEIVERLEWEKTKPMRMNLYGDILVKVDKAIEIVKEAGGMND